MILQVLFTMGVLAALAATIFKSLKRDADGEVTSIKIVPPALALVLGITALVGVLPAIGQVPAGHRGVVLQFGAPTGEVKQEGLFFLMPFTQSVEMMDVQVHAHKAPATAASKDLQNVATEITLNYRLDPKRVVEIYRDLRHDYEARIMTPSVQEAVKATTARFDAERLIVERPLVRDAIEGALKDRLARHGILFDQISITDFKFSPDFTEAIESKVVAVQQALQAENDLKRIKTLAEGAVATAKGNAEAIKIQAEAIQRQGGEEYVRLQAIAKWNGQMPTWMAGGQAMPFIGVQK